MKRANPYDIRVRRLLALQAALMLVNCDHQPAPTTSPSTPQHASSSAASPASASPTASASSSAAAALSANLPSRMEEYREPTWALPASWREVVPDAGLMMKRAPEWALPRAKDDRADAMLSAYGVPENATVEEGWTNSFPDGPLRFSEEAVLGQAVTIVEGKGSYSRGHATGDAGKKGYALLGAVVKLNRPFRTMGAYTLCTKFVFEVIGPEKTVLAAREDFLTLVRGVRP